MMELPFTTEQFLGVFREYNTTIWPAQIFAYLLGIGAVVLVIRKSKYSDKIINMILGMFWVWMGGIYHLVFFSAINKAAYLFGSLFLVQGLLFLVRGNRERRLQFHFKHDAFGITGAVLVTYALLIYPVLGAFLGHSYPYAPMFGVAPCPATIFTFGLLLWTTGNTPGWLLAIPGLWSIIGFTAALKLGIIEDIGLLIAGMLAIAMLLYRNRSGTKLRATQKD